MDPENKPAEPAPTPITHPRVYTFRYEFVMSNGLVQRQVIKATFDKSEPERAVKVKVIKTIRESMARARTPGVPSVLFSVGPLTVDLSRVDAFRVD